ncbi:MAG TPA: ABC transporter ATP-binding protein [Verrucomicrobiae bacterium]|nr:ABC transporter ATP-binding protein [Verrucomicrobiae bacterium]
MAAIRIENLTKTYRAGWRGKETTAVRNLSVEVNEGEIFGFLGPNGAGKTTTIHILLNLIRPTDGAAYLFDCPVTESEVHRRLGYLPETVNLHDYYRGRALLEFYAALCGLPAESRQARVSQLLKLLKLEDAADKVVARYSKGMAQRIGFAQALLHDPDLLILDEPTASLDPVGRKEFRDILLDLKRRGKTVLISSHILSEVESVCDRVAILQTGELKRAGTLAELSAGRCTIITVKSLPPDVLNALTTTAVQITLAQGQFTIRCPDEPLHQLVGDLLRQNNIEIVRTQAESQSLEEIFFSSIEAPPRL